MKRIHERVRPAIWVAALALVLLVFQAVSLTVRAREGRSDIGVFHRTGQLVAEGAGAELYREGDEASGWYRTIPPAGIWPFVWLGRLSPGVAGTVWGIFNLVLVGLGAWLALRLWELAGGGERAAPWALAVWFILSAACIQVGQFSILFTTCWLAAAWGLATRRDTLAGLTLCLPVTIKLYPIFVLPIVLARRGWGRPVLFAAIGLVVFGFVLPRIVIGPTTTDLLSGFFTETVLGAEGRVAAYGVGPDSITNQGLSAVIARYTGPDPAFGGRYSLPHLDAPVLAAWVAGAIRVVVVVLTLRAALALRKHLDGGAIVAALALWCSALYVVLPETKARYAVYVFPAFLWLLIRWTGTGRDPGSRLARTALVLGCLVGLFGGLPGFVLATGLPYLASLLLWAAVLATSSRRTSAPALERA